jgi:hypothetical protein
MKLRVTILAAILMNLLISPTSAEATCERLSSLSLPGAFPGLWAVEIQAGLIAAIEVDRC